MCLNNWWVVTMAGLVAMLAQPVLAQQVSFAAPLEVPARVSALAVQAPLMAIARAGERLVAVGMRGHIVYSDDAGKTWTQASVPVQTDLVAVAFATPEHGWAVGHLGVALETRDAGRSWQRRLGGSELHQSLERHYLGHADDPDSRAAQILAQVRRDAEDGTPSALLDVWFDSATEGTIVGTFNTILRTVDGGATWTPVLERTDNPDDLHFYAVRGTAQGLYAAGEQGSVWRLEDGRWVGVPTGYTGTLFGLVADGQKVVAYGMRGSVFLSEDAGAHWQQIDVPTRAGLVAGARMLGGDIVLVDQTGLLLRSSDGGRSFAVVAGAQRVPAFAVAVAGAGQLVSAGPLGAGVVTLP